MNRFWIDIRMPSFCPVLLVALFFLTTPLDALQSSPQVRFGERVESGRIESGLIRESSGLASSLVHDDLFWTHNDNGQNPGLFLINAQGKLYAHIQLAEVSFRDWEDIDCVRIDDRNYLVLGNTGDNLARYDSCQLIVFEEPGFDLPETGGDPVELTIQELAKVEFVYPDGPRDCEALAVDPASRRIFLVSKRIQATSDENETLFYWLPWQSRSTVRPLVANPLNSGFNEPLVTGMDISPGNDLAVVRTYATTWVYQRGDRSWTETFAGKPVTRSLLPFQRQGEAICFGPSGTSLFVTSEGLRPSIWRIGISTGSRDR